MNEMSKLERDYLSALERLPEGITAEEVAEIHRYANATASHEKVYTYMGAVVAAMDILTSRGTTPALSTLASEMSTSIAIISVALAAIRDLASGGGWSKHLLAIQARLYFNKNPNHNITERVLSLRFQIITKVLWRSKHLENFTNKILSIDETKSITDRAQKFIFSGMAKWFDKNVMQFKNHAEEKLYKYKSFNDNDREAVRAYFKEALARKYQETLRQKKEGATEKPACEQIAAMVAEQSPSPAETVEKILSSMRAEKSPAYNTQT